MMSAPYAPVTVAAARPAADTMGGGGGGAGGGTVGGAGGGAGGVGRAKHTSSRFTLEYALLSWSFVQLNQSVTFPT